MREEEGKFGGQGEKSKRQQDKQPPEKGCLGDSVPNSDLEAVRSQSKAATSEPILPGFHSLWGLMRLL